ncbi:MAG: NAD(P)-dependent oxidoreductase [Bacteroidales bacterium]|nr:NAD(P)-dependent oxidoreductase [Bacteroidales bacterium]
MKLLITGATGFIGRHVMDFFHNQGYQIAVLVRNSENEFPDGCGVFVYDNTLASVLQCLDTFKPDIIIHLGALFLSSHKPDDVAPLITANLLFGSFLLEAMKESGVSRLIHAGTSWQHFNNDRYNPVNLYAATKQAFMDICEYYAQAHKFNIIQLCLFDSYGPLDRRKKIVDVLLDAAESGEQISLSPGEQKLVLLHVHDIVRAFLAAINLVVKKHNRNKEYMVRGNQEVSLKQLAGIISDITGKEIHTAFGALPYRAREVMKPWSRGRNLPGWRQTIGIREGIQLMLREKK